MQTVNDDLEPLDHDAIITTLISTEELEIVRMVFTDETTVVYTVRVPQPVKPEALAQFPSYLPGWCLLESVEEGDGQWYFTFSAIA